MADWSDQITEMQKKWVEQQQKLMKDWLESMKSAGGAPQADWRQAADVMEQQVNSALETQKRSLSSVAGNMESFESAPEELKQVVKQIEEGLERWTEVQRQMWKVWFDMLREASATPKSPADSMLENWENMVKQTMSVQEQWLSNFTGAKGASGEKPAKTSKKPAKTSKKTAKKSKKKTS